MSRGRAYNYEFKMLLEGIEIPFKSANIVCTPNGVEMNVNVHVNEELFNLKPKTSVQIFFREWYGSNKAWRFMGDGFFSGYIFGEDSMGGRAVGITCRDFRMDIRKSPAAIAWMGVKETPGTPQSLYSVNGLKQRITTKKLITNKDSGDDVVEVDGTPTRLYDQTGLMDLSMAISRIAGTAYGKSGSFNGGNAFDAFNFSTDELSDSQMDKASNTGKKYANGGLFLDAFIRGIWMEAVGGTRVNSFLNKRIRADKRFFIPRNYAGFNFWKRNNFGLEVGSAIMGNSRFSSLEAAMMNVAGMFSCRVYSCNTPTLIHLDQSNPGIEYIMDPSVVRFLRANSEEFGAPYILNQTMLLPPLEFTSPPNCNLFFPPMYDKLSWQRDDDGDMTRGYFGVIHSLATKNGPDFGQIKFQVPNDMFGVTAEKVTGETKAEKKITKKRLPMTLEERYKGVNIYYGSVEYNLAAADAAKSMLLSVANKKERLKELESKKEKILKNMVDLEKSASEDDTTLNIDFVASKEAINKVSEQIESAKSAASAEQAKVTAKNIVDDDVANAYKRHAMIKYLNAKYSGRVIQIDMAFNPFVMCGFPGAIISAEETLGTNVTKTFIGMVQQVSHTIMITPNGAEAATTVIMNNVRFEDEPTDMDKNGLPLYVKATDREKAKVNMSSLEFESTYFTPDAKSPEIVDETSTKFDLKERKIGEEGYIYVKDFLTTSESDLSKGIEERIYVDRSYEPNRIFKFYKNVLKHRKQHFMLGTNGSDRFAYDSIHEALYDLRRLRPELLTDYSQCISFVEREICSADAFYHGILGLSSYEHVNVSGLAIENQYVNRTESFLDSVIHNEYFGVSTDDFATDKVSGLNMRKAGEFSSIREYSPITAFTKERRQAAEAYRDSAIKRAAGVTFNGR